MDLDTAFYIAWGLRFWRGTEDASNYSQPQRDDDTSCCDIIQKGLR